MTTAAAAVTRSFSTNKEARNSVGRVAASPSAVTIGVPTESRSQPRRNETTESPTVNARITTDPSAPPSTEITMSWISEIEGSPNSVEVSFASIASQSDEVSVVTIATVTLSRSTPSRRSVAWKRPVWMLVPSRASSAPKIVPRIPTAAGINTRSPGSRSSEPVMWLRIRPATKPAAVLRTSAATPCRIVRRSERRTATSRGRRRARGITARDSSIGSSGDRAQYRSGDEAGATARPSLDPVAGEEQPERQPGLVAVTSEPAHDRRVGDGLRYDP